MEALKCHHSIQENVIYPYNRIYLAIKRSEVLTHDTKWMIFENIVVSEKMPVIKGHIIYDSIYRKFPKQENL